MSDSLHQGLLLRRKPEILKIFGWWSYMQQCYGSHFDGHSTNWRCIRDEVAAYPDMCESDIRLIPVAAHNAETLVEPQCWWYADETAKVECGGQDAHATQPMNLIEI